ncbi:LysR family transcriptional regulator [uncultured Alteromonas sp.]|uniref:LysR family transcriptional regulator n=1 Tax=uncultured Alteromonas sp. TaxID=179113 RepID=UPI002589A90A|nr:LysR family transcriptional regulator [uncultured Alteromonas sp.]
MNSKQLQYFLTTVLKGSIAGAARELDIAQPAISQQLASLEREMGAQLLSRTFSGVTLTPAGDLFLTHATRLMDDINNAKSELRELVGKTAGTVKVGMLPSIGNVLSMPLIAEVKQNHPKLKLEISTGPSYSVKGWLEGRQVDIALTYEQDVDPRFMTVSPLIRENLHLVMANQATSSEYSHLAGRESIPFWALSQFPLLSPGNKDALGKLIEHYEKATGVNLQHNLAYSGQLMTGLRQVMQGEGVMILPTSAIFHLEESGLVSTLKIVEPEMQRLVLAATNKTSPLNEAVLKMLKVIKQVVASEQALQHWRGSLAFTDQSEMKGVLASGSLMSS